MRMRNLRYRLHISLISRIANCYRKKWRSFRQIQLNIQAEDTILQAGYFTLDQGIYKTSPDNKVS